LYVSDWDEIYAVGFRAVDGEIVDLAEIVTLRGPRIPVMGVVAAGAEPHGALTKSPCLALNSSEPSSVIDHEVTAGVLANREENPEARIDKCERDGGLRPIADCLRMLHYFTVPDASAGPCPNQTTQCWPTMWKAPE
jgi:hypothetical protein